MTYYPPINTARQGWTVFEDVFICFLQEMGISQCQVGFLFEGSIKRFRFFWLKETSPCFMAFSHQGLWTCGTTQTEQSRSFALCRADSFTILWAPWMWLPVSANYGDINPRSTPPQMLIADDECKGFLPPCMQNLRKIQVLSKRSCFFFRKFAKGGVEPAAGGKLSGNFGSFRMDGFLLGFVVQRLNQSQYTYTKVSWNFTSRPVYIDIYMSIYIYIY